MVARASRAREQALSLAVDTNVIIGLVAGTQAAAELASTVLEKHAERQGLLICPIVYAELFAHPGWSKKEMDAFLRATTIGVQWEIAREVWEAAGSAWAEYAARRKRQPSSAPRSLLADFAIGAHAAATGGLITGDAAFYRTNFPDLRLITM